MAVKLLRDDDTVEVCDAEIVDGGDKDTVYTIRKITPEKYSEFLRRHMKKATLRREERLTTEGSRNLNNDILDYVLVAWRGVVDGSTPVPCERDYKLRLDPIRRVNITDRAGVAEIVAAEEARGESFRPA